MWRLFERIMNLLIIGLIILGFVTTFVNCAAGERAVERKVTRLPVSPVADSKAAEQRDVLESHGVPDMVWRRQIGVELWVYCERPSKPRLIEFGHDGRILAEWRSGNKAYCSDATEILVDK